ncbi:MAG TPA: BREX system ATP-binding domain-containing protein, partial [Thermoplasmata archaeon]|nr:BREX system ATP-binding domain-containing protein [Thermoplasmata archaeon]
MATAERPFVGRLEAVDALRRRRDAAADGRGGLTLLEGEVGVGKSTLLTIVIEEAREKGMRVLTGRAPALENPPPFLLARSALES